MFQNSLRTGETASIKKNESESVFQSYSDSVWITIHRKCNKKF